MAHTVGPVLQRKFEGLRPQLDDAQRKYRNHKKNVLASGNLQPPELFWKNDAMARLADDCLDIKVLDPAMGSGHFLVEAVDFVSNQLIDFLNGWSENPVWGLLARTQEDILADMVRQEVTIDRRKLTRVNLLKRAVLKRGIYGVDLNEMAVELAKLSLWLDAFTLGAPLSFLDHHLKNGNSLIGVRIKEVEDALEAAEAEQLGLLEQSQFAGVMLATDLMRQVGYLSDNTVSQLEESRRQYEQAVAHLAPYKRMLDVYTSRWFGNHPNLGKAKAFDPTIAFLKRDDAVDWLNDPTKAFPERDYMDARGVAATALAAAKGKRFFHWELEFPEVFFAASTPGGQDIDLREGAGFDAVVGNPPYAELSELDAGRSLPEKDFFNSYPGFGSAQESEGRLNWYHYFMVQGLNLARHAGLCSFIVPMSWMGDSFTVGVRRWMLREHTPLRVEAFPQKDDPRDRVFYEAKLPTSIFVSQKGIVQAELRVRVHPGRLILPSPHYEANLSAIMALSPNSWLIPLVTPDEWRILSRLAQDSNLGRLDAHGAVPTSGEIIFNAATRPYMTSDSHYDLILRGSHVQRYELVEKAKQGVPEYLNTAAYLAQAGTDSKAFAFKHPRIVYQEGSAIDAWRRVVPTYLPAGAICGHKICYFTDYKIDMFAFLAIYASNFVNWLVEKLSVTNSLPAYLIGSLPFPILNKPVNEEHEELSQENLARLAHRMLDLNKRRAVETKRFLTWLESRLHIKLDKDGATGIDSLAGKSILQNYLGDYQKGERERTWDEFYGRLFQNRRRFGVVLADVRGEIEAEYEKSLAVLQPIKQQLAATDNLIDKIVYRLYGLTEEEIAIIEGPAFEQAQADAKAAVVGDKELQADPDKALAEMADRVRAGGRAGGQSALAGRRAQAARCGAARVEPLSRRRRQGAAHGRIFDPQHARWPGLLRDGCGVRQGSGGRDLSSHLPALSRGGRVHRG